MVIEKYKLPTQTQYGYVVKLFLTLQTTKKINMNRIWITVLTVSEMNTLTYCQKVKR